MPDITLEDIRAWREDTRAFQKEVRDRLDEMSDVIHEVQTTVAVLKDRDDREAPSKSRPAVWGSISAGVVVGVIEAVRAFSK